MTLPSMAFDPVDGLRDTTEYIVTPVDQTAAREQIQGRLDELRDYINDTQNPAIDTLISNIIETGNWTPTVEAETTATTPTYSTQSGTYVRVGKLLNCRFNITFTTSGGTGNILLTGLPVTPAKAFVTGSMGVNTKGGAGLSYMSIMAPSALPKFRVVKNTGLYAAITDINDGSTITLVGSVSYEIA